VQNIWLSAKEWPQLLTVRHAVTARGPSTRAKYASRRISAERVQESSQRRELHWWSFNVRPSPRASCATCRGTRTHGVGEVVDDEPCDEPCDVLSHLDVWRGRSSRWRACARRSSQRRAALRAEAPGCAA
jgi:hypothetical protein